MLREALLSFIESEWYWLLVVFPVWLWVVLGGMRWWLSRGESRGD